MINKFTIVLAIGIILRLLLASTSYHADIHALAFAGKVIDQGNILNFYDYLPNLPHDDPIFKIYPPNLFIYPPLVYLLASAPMGILSLLTGASFQHTFIYNISQTFGDPRLFLQLLILKLPYLIYDLGIVFLIMKVFQSERERFLGLLLWMFNPVNLYVTYLIGQFDIIPTFFVVLSIFIIYTSKPANDKSLSWAALVLGIGAAVKISPLFFLVPVASLSNNWKSKIKILVIGFIPYMISVLPYIFSKGFRSSALVANQTLKSFYAQIPVSGGESIILFIILLMFIYIIMLNNKGIKVLIWQRYLIAILPFYIFTHFHPQWFIWITPILIIELIKTRFHNLLPLVIMSTSFIGSLFFFDPGLTINLFAPLIPSLYNGLSLWQIFKLNVDINFFRSILQSLFVGSAVYYFYLYFPKKGEQET